MSSLITKTTDFLGITNVKAKEVVQPNRPIYNIEEEGEKKILLEWDSTDRELEKASFGSAKNRTLLIIGAVVTLLLLAMQEYFLIVATASIVFLKYVLSSTPPEKVHHEISNHGVSYAGQFYGWDDLKIFFFKKGITAETLCIDTIEKLPGRLFLLLADVDKNKAKEVVGKYLPFLEEEPKNVFDKTYDAAVEKISIEG